MEWQRALSPSPVFAIALGMMSVAANGARRRNRAQKIARIAKSREPRTHVIATASPSPRTRSRERDPANRKPQTQNPTRPLILKDPRTPQTLPTRKLVGKAKGKKHAGTESRNRHARQFGPARKSRSRLASLPKQARFVFVTLICGSNFRIKGPSIPIAFFHLQLSHSFLVRTHIPLLPSLVKIFSNPTNMPPKSAEKKPSSTGGKGKRSLFS